MMTQMTPAEMSCTSRPSKLSNTFFSAGLPPVTGRFSENSRLSRQFKLSTCRILVLSSL